MKNEERTTRRYSVSFRRMVVTEFEKGVNLGYLQRKYGINGGETIQNWVRSFGKNHLLNKVVRIETMGEKDRIKDLERQLKEASSPWQMPQWKSDFMRSRWRKRTKNLRRI